MTRRLFIFALVVYAALMALAYVVGEPYVALGSQVPAGAPNTVPAPTTNPKCYLQRAKCATHQPTPAVGVGRCDRNPGQLNAGSCLPRRVPRYVPPAWLWRYTVRWTA